MTRSLASGSHVPVQRQDGVPRFELQCCSTGVNVPTSPSCCACQLLTVPEIPDHTATTAAHAKSTYTTTAIEVAIVWRARTEGMTENIAASVRGSNRRSGLGVAVDRSSSRDP